MPWELLPSAPPETSPNRAESLLPAGPGARNRESALPSEGGGGRIVPNGLLFLNLAFGVGYFDMRMPPGCGVLGQFAQSGSIWVGLVALPRPERIVLVRI